MNLNEVSEHIAQIEAQVRRALIGQDEVLNGVLVAILAGGHVLLEGVPGVGKTLLVKALGRVLGCDPSRVQFTPDLMPSDVTGASFFNEREASFIFQKGPIFAQMLLADEINRAPAKTQSAMLEAMAEGAVTVEGQTHALPKPFFVLATQNPLESAGTYPLPEAQLDRFLFKLVIEHPSRAVEEQLLRSVRDGFDARNLDTAGITRVSSAETILAMQAAIDTVRVDDAIIGYIAQITEQSRRNRAVLVGASPRASIALLRCARVQAVISGRDFVTPDDVKTHCASILRHRLILQPDAEMNGVSPDDVVRAVLNEAQVPGMTDEAPVEARA